SVLASRRHVLVRQARLVRSLAPPFHRDRADDAGLETWGIKFLARAQAAGVGAQRGEQRVHGASHGGDRPAPGNNYVWLTHTTSILPPRPFALRRKSRRPREASGR